MPIPIQASLEQALSNFHLKSPNAPNFCITDRATTRAPDQHLVAFPITHCRQLYEPDEGRSFAQGNKRSLGMERLPANWDWDRAGHSFTGTANSAYHGHKAPAYRQPWCMGDPAPAPYFYKDTRFAHEQVGIFLQPPAKRDFGHLHLPVQPGPLKALVLCLKAGILHITSTVVNRLGALISALWSLLWLFVTYGIVAPMLGVFRIIRLAKIELLLALLLADWIVRLLPSFGSTVVSESELSGGEEISEWKIFIKCNTAMGTTGPVLGA